ncbi:glycogen/starch synthase [Allostreptomyces psammosilenae]|uniref:D-inositol 3-phosphate glycosyltransferase n=1 Tax=Allostreptomyces psammosilenae TaxID=1892865 RepID=A0A852ZR39_9ACTN|nr:glycogen/starch synthase [Allostreptomyces psammosilenae]NYI04215.1 hypothetical protein [Allostreptomyces psammosilenae]
MHIIETYFECCGFDHTFLQGGTSVYLWNLSRTFAARGHRVSIVTPAHGRLDDLRRRHRVEDLDYVDEYTLPLVLDPRVWGDGFPEEVRVPLRTTAHRIRKDGVDLYFLSNAYLDQLPDTFYPPYSSKGRDLVFFKPLAFQVDSVRFLRRHFAGDPAVVHAHEPYYHYLLPAALRDDPDKRVVSTVQSNMPITKKVYRPKVRRLLELLGSDVELPAEDPPAPTTGLGAAMSQYQQLTHLHYAYPPDHVTVYDLVAEHADLIDFLSPGQRDFYTTFADTPFERLFPQLPVHDVVRRNAGKRFVGGCAISDAWLADDPGRVDRAAVLGGLGLDPALPTFFHNARYAVHHKGQLELVRAVDRVLDEGLAANFVLRCISGTGIDDPYFHDVAERHRGRVHLEWERVDERRVFEYAASADFALFPSKFEMDTFLIAQGEAMVCGAVPIATAQQGMAHFGHVPDPTDGPDAERATGFAVNRSFAEDDPLLVTALADTIRRAVGLLRDRPEEYRRLSRNAVANARRFTWERCADQHLEAFTALLEGGPAPLPVTEALRAGWFDLLPPDAWRLHRERIAEAAEERGDADAYRRCRELDGAAARRLFRAAWDRADFARCERVLALAPGEVPEEAVAALRGRGRIVRAGTGSAPAWEVRYRLPHAARVELVLPGAPVDGGRPVPTVLPLAPVGDGHAVTVPGPPPEDGAHLLLTLASGRVTWDSIEVEETRDA